MKKTIALACLVLLVACTTLTPEESLRLHELTQIAAARPLTLEELNEKVELIRKAAEGQPDWAQILLTALGAVGTSLFGARQYVLATRGPVDHRRGLPPVAPAGG